MPYGYVILLINAADVLLNSGAIQRIICLRVIKPIVKHLLYTLFIDLGEGLEAFFLQESTSILLALRII